jgi:heptaprenyl diphosphate synthase
MELQKTNLHIDNYIAEVERSIYEPVVDRDVGRMTVDAIKAFFLLLPMLNGERWNNRLNTAAIAVGAVHAAFEAHDSIDMFNATSRQQQLTVLSGDHFSGVHYRLLASIPEFGFIRSLSKTIGEINEKKTTFHDRIPNGPDKLLETIRVIEAGCITDFLLTFGFSEYVPLASAVLPLIWLEGMETEGASNGTSHSRRQLNAADANHAIMQLRSEIQEAVDAADFLAPFLQQKIRNLTTPLLGKLN